MCCLGGASICRPCPRHFSRRVNLKFTCEPSQTYSSPCLLPSWPLTAGYRGGCPTFNLLRIGWEWGLVAGTCGAHEQGRYRLLKTRTALCFPNDLISTVQRRGRHSDLLRDTVADPSAAAATALLFSCLFRAAQQRLITRGPPLLRGFAPRPILKTLQTLSCGRPL